MKTIIPSQKCILNSNKNLVAFEEIGCWFGKQMFASRTLFFKHVQYHQWFSRVGQGINVSVNSSINKFLPL